jgi:hypothetical protein
MHKTLCLVSSTEEVGGGWGGEHLWVGYMAQMAQYLPSKYKALSLNPSVWGGC